jgi:hypothetical protein
MSKLPTQAHKQSPSELAITREVSVSDILKAKQYDLKRPQLKTADQCNRRKVASSLDADAAFNLGPSREPL